jgi:hypothetical protein
MNAIPMTIPGTKRVTRATTVMLAFGAYDFPPEHLSVLSKEFNYFVTHKEDRLAHVRALMRSWATDPCTSDSIASRWMVMTSIDLVPIPAEAAYARYVRSQTQLPNSAFYCYDPPRIDAEVLKSRGYKGVDDLLSRCKVRSFEEMLKEGIDAWRVVAGETPNTVPRREIVYEGTVVAVVSDTRISSAMSEHWNRSSAVLHGTVLRTLDHLTLNSLNFRFNNTNEGFRCECVINPQFSSTYMPINVSIPSFRSMPVSSSYVPPDESESGNRGYVIQPVQINEDNNVQVNSARAFMRSLVL